MTNNEQLILFVLHNQREIKKIMSPYIDQYNKLIDSNNTFDRDIKSEYLSTLKWIMRKEILGAFKNMSIVDVYLFVDKFDILEYLK